MIMGLAVFAQKPNSTLQQADKAYENLQFDAAAKFYEKNYAAGNADNKIAMKIADCYWNTRAYNKSLLWYNKLPKEVISENELLSRRYAELNAMKGDYDFAAEKLNKINGLQNRAEGFRYKNEFVKDSADWYIGFANINTPEYREFSPLILGQKFVWSTNEPIKKSKNGIMGWDANSYVRQRYLSSVSNVGSRNFPETKTNDSVSSRNVSNYAKRHAGADVSLKSLNYFPADLIKNRKYRMHQPLELKGFEKTYFNIGHATASVKTGKVYLTVNHQDDLKSSNLRGLGIVEADIENDFISNPHFLALGEKSEVILHAAIHPDGQYLVYSSSKSGGKGGYDLYLVKKGTDGNWSTSQALSNLNTVGNEVFSTFAPNGDLYFSSDGHPGLGGLDIYKVGFNNGAIVGNPEHLSFPINSNADEFGMILTQNGDHGYFTTDRFGSDDILTFDYEKKYAPLKGIVLERATNIRKSNVPVALYFKDYKGVQFKIDSTLTDKNGVYNFALARPNRDYFIKVYEPVKPDGAQEVVIIRANTSPASMAKDLAVAVIGPEQPKAPVEEPVLAKAPITSPVETLPASAPVAAEPKMVLDSVYFIIYFDFDKYALTPTSIATLNRATAFLKNNPTYGFVLLGHTDLKGNVDYNIKLSKNRVYAANNYLAAKGIDPTRFKLEYYGKSRPSKSGLSEDDGRLNRRVEFILIKK
ncbi:MAG: OmpA family protein [Chitinophagaceae bacterium]